MTSTQQVVPLRNAAASHWMHRGMELADKNTRSNLLEAVLCFDEAITLRSTLPFAEVPWFRYALSAGWINRADALARLEREDAFAEAIRSYDEALALLKNLPLGETPLYARRLAITWTQRGVAIQNRGSTSRVGEALACFESALRVLDDPSLAALEDRRDMQAGVWANWAAASLLRTDCNLAAIRRAVRTSRALTAGHEKSDPDAARTGLAARLTLCRFAVRQLARGQALPGELLADATDAADGGMELSRQWEARGETRWRETVRELFRLGCQIYQECQPQFVAEFILECLDPEASVPAVPPDATLLRVATAAIWSVADRLQRKSFAVLPNGGSGCSLDEVRALHAAEERLKKIACRLSATP